LCKNAWILKRVRPVAGGEMNAGARLRELAAMDEMCGLAASERDKPPGNTSIRDRAVLRQAGFGDARGRCVAFSIAGSEDARVDVLAIDALRMHGLRPSFGLVPRTGAMALSWIWTSWGPSAEPWKIAR